MDMIDVINNLNNDIDLIEFIKRFHASFYDLIFNNIDYLNNKKYNNYFRGYLFNNRTLMKKYYNLNIKIYYFALLYNKSNKSKFYIKKSANYMSENNIYDFNFLFEFKKTKYLYYCFKLKKDCDLREYLIQIYFIKFIFMKHKK